MTIELSHRQAQQLHLAAQGLSTRPRRRARKPDVLAAIARMQLLQIDTIHVVARSPYLVLFSRLGPYRTQWLEELLAEGALFEAWAHEACFAPIADYPAHRQHVEAESRRHFSMRIARHAQTNHGDSMTALLEQVRLRGPVKSSDFARAAGTGTGGGWWGWKAEKRWLEALFALGDLMIARRENFQRVYDLTERVLARALPDFTRASMPSDEAMRRTFILKTVQALGVTQARWMADYFRLGRQLKDAELDRLVEDGDLLRVRVEGWKTPGYVHASQADLAARAADGSLRATYTTLLSPFDPVVWHRERASMLFGFDYRIECYTPAPKRQFGYFVLPILRRGRLVGRLDAKAHRAEAQFEVKAIYLEPDVKPDDALARDLAAAIQACADWHATPKVVVRRSSPRELMKSLRAALVALARD